MTQENHIRLLDCTLRDGGHIVDGLFGEDVIRNTVRCLVESKVDIIEVGFLWDKECSADTARYHTISDVKRILPPNLGDSKIALMADYIDLEHLEPYDGTVEYIRLSFKRWRLDWGIKTAKILMEKGYKVFINPVNNNVYTDKQYIEVLEEVNKLHPYGFSIVDTFGVMRLRDLSHRYYLVEKNLLKDITIGVHLHENLGLAYSLAQHAIGISSPKRKIVIDGSLLGMGRVPGNLCIEQIMDYINDQIEDKYSIEPVFDAIDDYIAPIKAKKPWGYAIPYALSGKYYIHRTYAEFLMSKWKLRTSDIERILSRVKKEEAETYNEEYIDSLYREYVSIYVDDSKAKLVLSKVLSDREVLLIAPGASILESKGKILKFIETNKPVVIGIHCNPDFLKPEFVFFSNIKRFEVLHKNDYKGQLIISSNLTRYIHDESIVINYDDMAIHDGVFCDDSVLMMLNLLKHIGVEKITVAGFDGVKDGKGNFYINSLSRNDRPADYSDNILEILTDHYHDLNLNFLTDSYYRNYNRRTLENDKLD